ncbi:zinc-dependent metalloprotease [Lewinella sp. 4G2]|uniref:zinc-dependent metalloprotease n=1 Tax=Lewinella sp. 4G2 TaxID=1803372 RepID=UPI0007B4EA35|nr:zinc-dependent metalloprotease [Lewinella sp. 4G2]OAV46046.1 hypothetical protein A3850_017415 [Lewinella sp. 4G2]
MRSFQRTCLFLLATLLVLPLSAQQKFTGDSHCGYEGKSQWLQDYQDGKLPAVQKSNNGINYLPLAVNMLADNNGTNYMSPLRFLDALTLLNSDFLDQDIQFYVEGGLRYINSTRYNDHDSNTGDEMMRTYNLPNRVNTYIVEDPNGNCGYYSGGRDAVVLGRNCLGGQDRTWSHEMGHYFSLPHTFYGWESVQEIAAIDLNNPAPATVRYRGRNVPTELADGSNCAVAADGFCDTDADFLMQRWGCNNQGFYPDSLMDADSVRFAVPAFNIMSYALDVCVSSFTQEQKDAMFANMESIIQNRPVASSPPNLEAASVDDLIMYAPEDRERLVYQDSVSMIWNSVPNASYYVVQVNQTSNFNGAVLLTTTTNDTTLTLTEGLSRRTTYYWRIRPVAEYNVGGAFGPTFQFRNGTQLTSTIDAELNAAINVAPNPVFGGQMLRIEGRDLDLTGTLNYQVINAAGQVMINRQGIPVNVSGISERIDTGNLPAGMYFLRMQVADRMISRRIVVTP